MVKRIFGSLMLVLIATVSILAQIDYNKQIKNGPAVSQGNTNNIRVVDGLKFAQTAAGINAADADLGSTIGEIWIPSPNVIATDAQISISANHTLKIFGRLSIDAVAKGPILLGSTSRVTCSNLGAIANITNTGVGTVPSMIRAVTQDGSLAGFSVEGCSIQAGGQPVTNGVIDISGSVSQGWIRNNVIVGFTSGWGIFAQDVQSGALGGTNSLEIQNNTISGTNTAGCIEIIHSATNAVTLNSFNIFDNNCFVGASSGNSVLIQNTSPQASFLRQISVQNLYISGTPAAQNAFVINGVQQGSFRNITCVGGSSAICVQIASNTNNGLINVENVITYSGNNALSDSLNSVNILSGVTHYTFSANTNSYDYLPAVSYLQVKGLGPASCTSTGTGTGPTCTFAGNPTNNAGIMQIVAGTTPGSSGTFTLNFGTTQTNFGGSTPSCVFTPHSTTGAWNPRVSIILFSTTSTAVQANWDNNAVNLTAGSQYNIHYWCVAH